MRGRYNTPLPTLLVVVECNFVVIMSSLPPSSPSPLYPSRLRYLFEFRIGASRDDDAISDVELCIKPDRVHSGDALTERERGDGEKGRGKEGMRG